MPLFANAAALRILDGVAVLLGQAYQRARCRIASASSPVLRMMAERDEVHVESDLLRRELQDPGTNSCAATTSPVVGQRPAWAGQSAAAS